MSGFTQCPHCGANTCTLDFICGKCGLVIHDKNAKRKDDEVGDADLWETGMKCTFGLATIVKADGPAHPDFYESENVMSDEFHPNHLGANLNDHPLNLIVRALSLKYGKEGEWADKYGTEYEDDKIMIRRYCNCVRDDCPCLTILDRRPEIGFEPINYPEIKRRWTTDALFWHKPTGFKMSWYKYIGRDTEFNMQPSQELLQCLIN